MSSTGEHLKPYHFPEGVSGNPNGRPKGRLNTKTILRMLLDEQVEMKDKNGNVIKLTSKEVAMHHKQISKAVNEGDTRAYNAVMDRLEGKALQRSEVELQGEIPVKIVGVEGFTGFGKPVDEPTDTD